MAFTLPELPYSKDALSPHISAETLEYHHGKHHKAYVDKLNELTATTGDAKKSLEDLIRSASGPRVASRCSSFKEIGLLTGASRFLSCT